MKKHDECCYEEMTHSIGGQSILSEYWEEPMRNDYEENHKSHYGKNGIDWSGMEK